MKPTSILILLLLLTKVSFAQYQPIDRSLNKVDENGKAQGLWMHYLIYNDSLKTTEQGFYLNGEKVGVWRFYNEDGLLEKVENHDGNGFYEKLYYFNNVVRSEGRYVVRVDTTVYWVENPVTAQMEKSTLGAERVKKGEWKYYKENGKLDAVEKY